MYSLASILELIDDTAPINPALQSSSAVLIYAAYDHLSKLYNWRGDGDELTSAEQDTIEAMIGALYADMVTPYECEECPVYNELPVGSIFASANTQSSPTLNAWTLYCNGASYLRVDYPELWAALGTPFRIDADNFAVPDLRQKFIYGAGSLPTALGGTGGATTHTLSIAEMPSHHHAQRYHSNPAGALAGLSALDVSSSTPTNMGTDTADTGGGGSHNNMPPYMILKWYIVAKPSS